MMHGCMTVLLYKLMGSYMTWVWLGQVSMLPEELKSKMASANGPVLGELLDGYPVKFNMYWKPVEYSDSDSDLETDGLS